jgi:hypothetical protein
MSSIAVKSGKARWRTTFKDVSVQGNRGAADTTVSPLIAARAKYTLYVQEIWANITTDAAQTITFRAITTTARVLLLTPSSPGLGLQKIEFDDEGYALPEGEGLEMVLSAAGLAFDYKVVAYQRPTATMIPSEM